MADDRLLADNTLCFVVVVLASVPEVHVQDEQFDRTETASRPPGRLLNELGANVVDAAVELLEHLNPPLDIREVLATSHKRVEQEPNDGELR